MHEDRETDITTLPDVAELAGQEQADLLGIDKDAKSTASKAVGDETGSGNLVGPSIRPNRSQWLRVERR